jgi:hypothetical protein
VRTDGPQAARAPILGESVQISSPGKESLGQSRVSEARDRAHHAGATASVYREVHNRWRAPEARQKIDEYKKNGELRSVARAALDMQTIESLEADLKSISEVLDGKEQPE